MFIDVHCHILPGIDDGADSFGEACDLITQAYSSGTTVMIATPHYNNTAQCSRDCSKSRVLEVYRELKECVIKNNIPVSLFLGSEMLADDNMDYLHRHEDIITINATRYILVEFRFDEDILNVHRYTDKLLSLGLIPVIAHPERYFFFDDEKKDIYRLLNKGCKLQINKGSPLGKYGSYAKELALWLLKNDFVHLIASDCHSASQRNADMRELYEWMLDKFSTERIARLTHDNPKRILLDRDI